MLNKVCWFVFAFVLVTLGLAFKTSGSLWYVIVTVIFLVALVVMMRGVA